MHILDVIFPRFCIGCGRKLVTGERYICLHCMAEMPRSVYPLTLVSYNSEGLTGKIVKKFKFRGDRLLARYCGQLMVSEIRHSNTTEGDKGEGFFDSIDAIVPVPLTRKRKLWRGYNQSEWLAKGISHDTGIPVCTDLLRRTRFETSQTQLLALERIDNVWGAFALNKRQALKFRNKHILLVDDVITVEATVRACKETLADIPGIEISILAFAKAREK